MLKQLDLKQDSINQSTVNQATNDSYNGYSPKILPAQINDIQDGRKYAQFKNRPGALIHQNVISGQNIGAAAIAGKSPGS